MGEMSSHHHRVTKGAERMNEADTSPILWDISPAIHFSFSISDRGVVLDALFLEKQFRNKPTRFSISLL